MRMHIVKYFVLPTFLAIISVVAGAWLIPKIDLQYTGISQISRADARTIVETFVKNRGIDVSEFYLDQFFIHDNTGIDFLARNYGAEETISLAQTETLPLAYWQFRYYRNAPRDNQIEFYDLRISPSGKLIKYQHLLPDSAAGARLTSEQAKRLAEELAAKWPSVKFSEYELEKASSIEKAKRTDHTFVYHSISKNYNGGHLAFVVQICGDEIAQISSYFREPDSFISQSGLVGGANLLFNSISILAYVFLLFLSIIIFLQKYHAGLVGVRNGLRIGALIYIAFILQTILSWDIFGLGTQIGAIGLFHKRFVILGFTLATSTLTIFLHIFTAWTVGDHIIQDEKLPLLHGMDSLIHNRWLTKNLGREIPIGIASGATIFGLIQFLSWLLIHFIDAVPRLSVQDGSYFSYKILFLGVMASIVFNVIFEEVVSRKFLITYLYQKYKKPALAIFVAAAITAIMNIFFSSAHIFWPSYWSLLPYFIIALLQGFVFWRHGLIAAICSNIVLQILPVMIPLFSSAAVEYQLNALAFAGTIVLLLGLGIVAFKKGKFIIFARSEEPAHIRRIKEQTRMQKELEIAQKVQLGLLPKEKPQIEGFDIAGVSYPALEVGGDYFDFIGLENGNLGIAIGDVSGKGVPAAIYMTLTKGILQSHAEHDLSPKQVLSKVNSLMYRTIEKSWYVSMFYAVLDTRAKKMRFSRAGHNPAIVFHTDGSAPQMLQPAGIGLGLEYGDVFTHTLVEGELQLSQGNTLVFYTDGFTEAMNAEGEEFGEDRFMEILSSYNNGSAEGLLQHTLREVNKFVDNYPQHDDMTMVVIKVK